MGNCVPPNRCDALIGDYYRFIEREDTVFKRLILELEPRVNRFSDDWPCSIDLDAFEDLSKNYWSGPHSSYRLPLFSDEYARKFCLSMEVAQNLQFEISSDRKKLLVKAWADVDPIDIPPEEKLNVNESHFDGKFSAEAYEQADNFLMYLIGSVNGNLPNEGVRLSYLFEFLTICLDGANHALYQAKALVKYPRPTLTRSLPMPATSSWPAGHAYICGATSAALFVALTKNLLSNDDKPIRERIASSLVQMSNRIGENREKAGLHFKEDTEAGFSMGFRIMAEVLMHAATTAPKGVSGEVTELCGYLNRALV